MFENSQKIMEEISQNGNMGGSTAVQFRKAVASGGLAARPLGGRHSYSTTDIPKATLNVTQERRIGGFTGERIRARDIPDSPTSSSSESGLNGDIVTDSHSIPVRLEKILGSNKRKHYMLKIDGDIREILLELEKEERKQVSSGKKGHRRKRFSDVCSRYTRGEGQDTNIAAILLAGFYQTVHYI